MGATLAGVLLTLFSRLVRVLNFFLLPADDDYELYSASLTVITGMICNDTGYIPDNFGRLNVLFRVDSVGALVFASDFTSEVA